jgi:hypothetical protein
LYIIQPVTEVITGCKAKTYKFHCASWTTSLKTNTQQVEWNKRCAASLYFQNHISFPAKYHSQFYWFLQYFLGGGGEDEASSYCLVKSQSSVTILKSNNKVLRNISNFPRHALFRDSHIAFKIPYVYDYITKLCRQKAEVIQNHDNENVRNIGQGEARRRKYTRLKLDGGQAYDRSSD